MENHLDEYTRNYDYRGGVMHFATSYCAKIFQRYMKNGSILELGPAEGVMTELLYCEGSDYTVVEGAELFAKKMKEQYPKICVHNCYFEEFAPERKYDNIILGHVLEHVDNPVEILKRCKGWLSPQGVILTAVPNAHSIHRQAAVLMGLLKEESELNETDKGVGHKRVYNLPLLKKDFDDAELKIIDCGGYWLKPISNSQIEKTWNEDMINAFLVLGEKYSEIAAEIYVVAQL